MVLYSRLRDVPLPDTIYNGPLETRIVPLVKAVTSLNLTTIGSCEGHLDRFFPYPWVQIFPYDDLRLLKVLVEAYNQRENDVPWRLDGNSVRTEQEAHNLRELARLQRDIWHFSRFIFEHRPEVLDPEYKAMIKIPDLKSPEYLRVERSIDKAFDDLERMFERREASPSNPLLERAIDDGFRKLKRLHEEENNLPGEINIFPPTEEQMNSLLRKAAKILG